MGDAEEVGDEISAYGLLAIFLVWKYGIEAHVVRGGPLNAYTAVGAVGAVVQLFLPIKVV